MKLIIKRKVTITGIIFSYFVCSQPIFGLKKWQERRGMKMKERGRKQVKKKVDFIFIVWMDKEFIFSPIIFFPLSSFPLLSYPYNSSNQTCQKNVRAFSLNKLRKQVPKWCVLIGTKGRRKRSDLVKNARDANPLHKDSICICHNFRIQFPNEEI